MKKLITLGIVALAVLFGTLNSPAQTNWPPVKPSTTIIPGDAWYFSGPNVFFNEFNLGGTTGTNGSMVWNGVRYFGPEDFGPGAIFMAANSNYLAQRKEGFRLQTPTNSLLNLSISNQTDEFGRAFGSIMIDDTPLQTALGSLDTVVAGVTTNTGVDNLEIQTDTDSILTVLHEIDGAKSKITIGSTISPADVEGFETKTNGAAVYASKTNLDVHIANVTDAHGINNIQARADNAYALADIARSAAQAASDLANGVNTSLNDHKLNTTDAHGINLLWASSLGNSTSISNIWVYSSNHVANVTDAHGINLIWDAITSGGGDLTTHVANTTNAHGIDNLWVAYSNNAASLLGNWDYSSNHVANTTNAHGINILWDYSSNHVANITDAHGINLIRDRANNAYDLANAAGLLAQGTWAGLTNHIANVADAHGINNLWSAYSNNLSNITSLWAFTSNNAADIVSIWAFSSNNAAGISNLWEFSSNTASSLESNWTLSSNNAAGVSNIWDYSSNHVANTTNAHGIDNIWLSVSNNEANLTNLWGYSSNHVGDTNNPHLVTAAQVGAADYTFVLNHIHNTTNAHNIGEVRQLATNAWDLSTYCWWAITNLYDHLGMMTNQLYLNTSNLNWLIPAVGTISNDFWTHINNYNNPHQVTTDQIGAATTNDLATHTNDMNNPHQVTADQTGALSTNGGTMAVGSHITFSYSGVVEGLDVISGRGNMVDFEDSAFRGGWDFESMVAGVTNTVNFTGNGDTGVNVIVFPATQSNNPVTLDQMTNSLAERVPFTTNTLSPDGFPEKFITIELGNGNFDGGGIRLWDYADASYKDILVSDRGIFFMLDDLSFESIHIPRLALGTNEPVTNFPALNLIPGTNIFILTNGLDRTITVTNLDYAVITNPPAVPPALNLIPGVSIGIVTNGLDRTINVTNLTQLNLIPGAYIGIVSNGNDRTMAVTNLTLANSFTFGDFAGTEAITPKRVNANQFGWGAGEGVATLGSNWLAVGENAGAGVLGGTNWLAVGENAGLGATGSYFTAIGSSAGLGAGGNNGWSAIGQFAGAQSTGDYWTAIGSSAGREVIGDSWLALGNWSGSFDGTSLLPTKGDFFTAVGPDAGRNTTGDDWTAIGRWSGRGAVWSNSLAIGKYTGRNASGTNRLYIDTYASDPTNGYPTFSATNDMIYGNDGALSLGRAGNLATDKTNVFRGIWTGLNYNAITNQPTNVVKRIDINSVQHLPDSLGVATVTLNKGENLATVLDTSTGVVTLNANTNHYKLVVYNESVSSVNIPSVTAASGKGALYKLDLVYKPQGGVTFSWGAGTHWAGVPTPDAFVPAKTNWSYIIEVVAGDTTASVSPTTNVYW